MARSSYEILNLIEGFETTSKLKFRDHEIDHD